MNRKTICRIKITGAIFIALFLWTGTRAMAEERSVVVKDGTGNELEQEANGEYRSVQDVFFCLNKEELDEDECFVYSISLDGGNYFSSLSPVTDSVFPCTPPEEDNQKVCFLRFFRYHTKSGQTSLLREGEKTYKVNFAPESLKNLDVSFTHGKETQEGNMIYYREEAPELTVYPANTGTTYIRHETEGEEVTYIVGKDGMKLVAAEGLQTMDVWVERKDGSRVIGKDFPKTFLYDHTPPTDPVFSVSVNGGHYFKNMSEYQYYANGTISIQVDSTDRVSGIKKILLQCGEDEAVEGGSLVLKPPFQGGFRAKAVDMAGNESPWVNCFETVCMEKEQPEIEVSEWETAEEKCFAARLFDPGCGLWKMECRYDGELLKEEVFSRKMECLNEYAFELALSKERLTQEEKILEIRAVDNAGNESVVEVACRREDQLAPAIWITGCRNLEVVNQDVFLETTVTDENLAAIERKAVCMDENGKVVEVIPISTDKMRFQEEGNYVVTIEASDTFGNRNQDELHFTIDKSAPGIKGIADYDGKYLPEFRLAGKLSDMLSDYSMVSCELLLNGESFDESSEITEQGKYILKLTAKDEVGNISEEKAEFIIDRMPPEILILEPSGKKNGEIVIKTGDAEDRLTSVVIDGKEVFAPAGEEQSDFSYVLNTKTEHRVEVKAVDLAGNTAKISRQMMPEKTVLETKTVKLSENAAKDDTKEVIQEEKAPENFTIILSAIIGVFILAALVFWGFLRHRSKIDTENEVC